MDDAFEQLFHHHYARVVAYLRRFGFSDEEARDLAQDVFVATFRYFQNNADTIGWPFLKSAARNKAVNAIRSRSMHRRSESAPIAESERASDYIDGQRPSAENATLAKEESILLRSAIEALPPNLRQAVLLRLDGLTYREIATTLRLSVNSVKTRLRDAKVVLRKTAAIALSGHVRFDDGELAELMSGRSEKLDDTDEPPKLDAEIEALEMLKLRLAGVAAQVRRLNTQFDNYSAILTRHWDRIVNNTAKQIDSLDLSKP